MLNLSLEWSLGGMQNPLEYGDEPGQSDNDCKLASCHEINELKATVYSVKMTELNSSIAMCTFPKKYKHLNIVLRTFQSRIRNWKRAFRKFGKFEERVSKFLEIRKWGIGIFSYTIRMVRGLTIAC